MEKEAEPQANDVRASEDESASEPIIHSAEELDDSDVIEDEESSDAKSFQSEAFVGVDDVSMCMVYSCILPFPTSFCMELFGGSEIDERVMERAGCLNYSHSAWESDKLQPQADIYQRQLYYKLEKCIPLFRGEVASTQQKFRLSVRNAWVIDEVMSLQGVPLGDSFTVCIYSLVCFYLILLLVFVTTISFPLLNHCVCVVIICSFA